MHDNLIYTANYGYRSFSWFVRRNKSDGWLWHQWGYRARKGLTRICLNAAAFFAALMLIYWCSWHGFIGNNSNFTEDGDSRDMNILFSLFPTNTVFGRYCPWTQERIQNLNQLNNTKQRNVHGVTTAVCLEKVNLGCLRCWTHWRILQYITEVLGGWLPSTPSTTPTIKDYNLINVFTEILYKHMIYGQLFTRLRS